MYAPTPLAKLPETARMLGIGEIYVKDSDCTDKVCVRSGRICKSGESIICAPNRVTIKIDGKNGGMPDAMTG